MGGFREANLNLDLAHCKVAGLWVDLAFERFQEKSFLAVRV